MNREQQIKEYVERSQILAHKRKMAGVDLDEGFWDEAVLCEDIRNIPKADVQEVKHGEWIVCGDGEYVPFMCTACGKTTSWYHKQVADFCPRCGAKMDLNEREELVRVKQGEWLVNEVETSQSSYPTTGRYITMVTRATPVSFKCSNCGRIEMRPEPYCHCGAKMSKVHFPL